MTPVCSINDDWENCAAPPPPRRTKETPKTLTADESSAENVRVREPTQTGAVGDTPTKVEPLPCGHGDEIETLRARIDTDRQLLLAMASAMVIVLVMNIVVQIRLDNLLGRTIA